MDNVCLLACYHDYQYHRVSPTSSCVCDRFYRDEGFNHSYIACILEDGSNDCDLVFFNVGVLCYVSVIHPAY